MLIRSIEAENFMKFSRLSLNGLPARGVIGVEGPNESGKSTIGDAIIFAFFGRSRMTKDCPLENLIRWGSDFLRVSVEFSLPGERAGDESYIVFREVDRFGTNFVKLLKMPEKEEIAAGNIDVAAFFARHIEFDFFEFQHAFYHDQYGSRFVDATLREFVERLTGVRQMQTAGEDVRTEIEQLEREYSHYSRDIKRSLKQIGRHAGSADKLPELREAAMAASDDVSRHAEDVAAQTRDQDERRKLVSERDSSEKRLRDVAGHKGERLEKGIADLVSRYDALERRAGSSGVISGELAKEFRRLRGGVADIDAMLCDYGALRRAAADARESVQSDLSGGGGSASGSASGSEDGGGSLESRRDSHVGERDSAHRRVARSRRGLAFLILLVLVGGGIAAASWLQPGLLEKAGLPEAVKPIYIAAGGGAVALLALLMTIAKMVRVSGARAQASAADRLVADVEDQISTASGRVEQLDALRAVEDSGTVTDYVGAARLVTSTTVARRLEEFESKHAQLAGFKSSGESKGGGSGDYRQQLRSLADREKHCRKKLDSAIQSAGKKLKDAESQLRKATSDRDRSENEIRECEVQLAKKEVLEEKRREFETEAAAIRAKIDDRQEACELLESCIATTHAKVGPALSAYMHGVLPRLTGDRYRDVKLDANLDMLVFSSECRDFLPAAELSGGTNEALVLGLRLALSQAFVAARTRQPQFVFLDEPFKMMDAPRVLQAVLALPVLSADIQQFFVVQPQFTDEQRDALDFVVQTTIETTELEADLART